MVDKLKLRRIFSRAAKNYDTHAFIQKRIGEELLSQVSCEVENPELVLDIGMGTGWLTERLLLLYPKSKIFGMDLAEGMISFARKRKKEYFLIHSDAQLLPFKDCSYELVISNVVYQWVEDLFSAFEEVLRILKEKGRFFFTCFGQDTLKELKLSFSQVLKPTIYNKIFSQGSLPYKELVYKSLLKASFKDIDLTSHIQKEFYIDVFALVRWLKIVGANQTVEPIYLGGDIWKKVNDVYQANFNQNGKVFATFEIIWAKGTKI